MIRYSSFISFLFYFYFCFSTLYGFLLDRFDLQTINDNNRTKILWLKTMKLQAHIFSFCHRKYIQAYNKYETDKMKQIIKNTDDEINKLFFADMDTKESNIKPVMSKEELIDLILKMDKISKQDEMISKKDENDTETKTEESNDIIADFVSELEQITDK